MKRRRRHGRRPFEVDVMGADALGWVLAVLAGLAAGLAGWVARSQTQKRATLEEELVAERAQLSEERRKLDKRSRAFEERGKELGELRRRLDKTRRRAFDARESSGSLEGRIAELEGQLARREQQARDAGLALESVRGALTSRDAEVAQLQEQVAAARPQADPEEQVRLSRRVATQEAELRDLTQKVQEAERETTRYRSRERTHRRLYIVIKGELDVARDRLAALGSPASEPPHPPPDEEPPHPDGPE
jgi:chromosome segregation ATPase